MLLSGFFKKVSKDMHHLYKATYSLKDAGHFNQKQCDFMERFMCKEETAFLTVDLLDALVTAGIDDGVKITNFINAIKAGEVLTVKRTADPQTPPDKIIKTSVSDVSSPTKSFTTPSTGPDDNALRAAFLRRCNAAGIKSRDASSQDGDNDGYKSGPEKDGMINTQNYEFMTNGLRGNPAPSVESLELEETNAQATVEAVELDLHSVANHSSTKASVKAVEIVEAELPVTKFPVTEEPLEAGDAPIAVLPIDGVNAIPGHAKCFTAVQTPTAILVDKADAKLPVEDISVGTDVYVESPPKLSTANPWDGFPERLQVQEAEEFAKAGAEKHKSPKEIKYPTFKDTYIQTIAVNGLSQRTGYRSTVVHHGTVEDVVATSLDVTIDSAATNVDSAVTEIAQASSSSNTAAAVTCSDSVGDADAGADSLLTGIAQALSSSNTTATVTPADDVDTNVDVGAATTVVTQVFSSSDIGAIVAPVDADDTGVYADSVLTGVVQASSSNNAIAIVTLANADETNVVGTDAATTVIAQASSSSDKGAAVTPSDGDDDEDDYGVDAARVRVSQASSSSDADGAVTLADGDDNEDENDSDVRLNATKARIAQAPTFSSISHPSRSQPLARRVDSDPNHKGRRMMEKLGWTIGTSLGKNNTGILEPISQNAKASKGGLGRANGSSQKARSAVNSSKPATVVSASSAIVKPNKDVTTENTKKVADKPSWNTYKHDGAADGYWYKEPVLSKELTNVALEKSGGDFPNKTKKSPVSSPKPTRKQWLGIFVDYQADGPEGSKTIKFEACIKGVRRDRTDQRFLTTVHHVGVKVKARTRQVETKETGNLLGFMLVKQGDVLILQDSRGNGNYLALNERTGARGYVKIHGVNMSAATAEAVKYIPTGSSTSSTRSSPRSFGEA